MALSPSYLADKSALARLANPAVAARLEPLIETGAIATCGMVELEVLWSARGIAELRDVRREWGLSFPRVGITDGDFVRAADVLTLLAERSHHRSAKIPDLLIAAAAERAGLAVLHYDRDFDLIAEVTGQPAEWIVPAGSVS
ncbi:MAG TPA: PIN domain nuclease [Candidatus Limnocylindria bacterium]